MALLLALSACGSSSSPGGATSGAAASGTATSSGAMTSSGLSSSSGAAGGTGSSGGASGTTSASGTTTSTGATAGTGTSGSTASGATAGADGGDASTGATRAPEGGADASTDSSAPPDAAPPGAEAGTTYAMYVTFYGWADNSPPGASIAYGKSAGYPTVHDAAGGIGTYADPITFATDKAELGPGTRVYLPFAQKYAMMEDDCVECDTDWTTSSKRHIDIWMNSNGTEMSAALLACEDAWTKTSAPVEVNPPSGRTVSPAPLFTPATNVCTPAP